MKAKPINKLSKWKIYTLLIVVISLGTLALDVATLYASYPTQEHREVARSLNELGQKAFASGSPDGILESDEYKTLEGSTENAYSTRMSIASGVLSLILATAIIVAVYRYLRRNLITRRPVGATVLIYAFVSAITGAATLIFAVWLTPFAETTPALGLALAAAMPFAVAIGGLAAFVVAKVAEWHYNRSHGFIEE